MVDYDEKHEKKLDAWRTEVRYYKDGELVMTDVLTAGVPTQEELRHQREVDSYRRSHNFLIGMGMLAGFFVLLAAGGTGYTVIDVALALILLFGSIGFVARS